VLAAGRHAWASTKDDRRDAANPSSPPVGEIMNNAGDTTDPLARLTAAGQSVWLDYIRRGMLDDGELERMIRDASLRGVTSNPTIFEQAIGGSSDYDAALEDLGDGELSAGEIFEQLAVDDIRRAADLFRPVYDRSEGADGFVSLEVSPELADDTEATLDEARRLWQAVDRPNLMIKVPGTAAGVPAVEQLLLEGKNVNITLLFSLDDHARVMEAYLSSLERRAAEGLPVDRVASVASFFISRVDTAVDAQLEQRIEAATDDAERERLRGLLGRAAIANAKLAYRQFSEVFGGERFAKLREKGARVQRPLWASTSTKNPEYRDVIYVEELIGPDTVNTMPLATVEAFADHGVVARTIDQDVARAESDLRALAEAGIEMEAVTTALQTEGVEKFADSFRSLIDTVRQKVDRVTHGA
jgi:transaldolase